MTALLLLPAALSFLVLAAHFLRFGNYFAVAALLALVPVLALRRRWVPIVARIILWLAAALWIITALRFAGERMRFGEPWLRMAIILGAVAAFAVLASLPFSASSLRAFYGGAGQPLPQPARVRAPGGEEEE